MRSIATPVYVSLLLLSTPSLAQEPSATATPQPAPAVTTGATKLKIGGVLWPTFRYDLSEGGQDKNEFDVSRAYVNLYPSIGDQIDGRITIDVVAQDAGTDSTDEDVTTNTTGSLMLRLKYGYITYKPMGKLLELVAGQAPTPWINYEEEIWGYRVLNETGAGTRELWGIRSSDFGYGAKVRAVGDGQLEVHAQIQNGEGYSARERNKYKELAVRASYQVLPAKEGGLKVAAFHSQQDTERLAGETLSRTRTIGMLSMQHRLFTAAGGYVLGGEEEIDPTTGDLVTIAGSGPFAFGHVNVPVTVPGLTGIRVLARVDMADPDADTENDARTRIIAGVQALFHERASVVLDYQQLSFENPDADSVDFAFVHWDLRF